MSETKNIQPQQRSSFDAVKVEVYDSSKSLGLASAVAVAAAIKQCASTKQSVRMVMASAPSQTQMLEALLADNSINWSCVTIFHMDEFIGLPQEAPQRFANWLDKNLCAKISAKNFHRIEPDPDPQMAAENYAGLLAESPIDIVCLGIGVNGHIAFNDPPVADFNDPKSVKIVELDETCRQQQFSDQGFASIDHVPTHAITLTIPQLINATQMFCVVPGSHKALAVTKSLTGPIEEKCPASILRRHEQCTIYLDPESACDITA